MATQENRDNGTIEVSGSGIKLDAAIRLAIRMAKEWGKDVNLTFHGVTVHVTAGSSADAVMGEYTRKRYP